MKAIKEVEIRLHSVIDNLEDGLPTKEPEINITTHRGFMICEDTALSVSYTDRGEGGEVKCTIRIYENGVSLSRRGAIVSDLLFSEGEECRTSYAVGPYTFDMITKTVRVRGKIDLDGGEMALLYVMSVGGQEKNARMRITVTPLKDGL